MSMGYLQAMLEKKDELRESGTKVFFVDPKKEVTKVAVSRRNELSF